MFVITLFDDDVSTDVVMCEMKRVKVDDDDDDDGDDELSVQKRESSLNIRYCQKCTAQLT
jgi:hypothetical protein